MSLVARIASALLLAGALHTLALARDEAVPVRVQMLVPFASADGLDRLARANAKKDFAPLAQYMQRELIGEQEIVEMGYWLGVVRSRNPSFDFWRIGCSSTATGLITEVESLFHFASDCF